VALDKQLWKNCFDNNDDGAGIMYAKENKIIVDKGHFDFDKLYEAIEKLTDTDIVVHFRAASPGMIINASNTHPFNWENGTQFSKDDKTPRYQWAMCHNGRLKWNHTDKKSDTSCFADEFLYSYTDRDPYLFSNKLGLLMFEGFIGDNNKIVVMRHDTEENKTDVYIANEGKGHWKHKCWFSNSSYEDRPKYHNAIGYGDYATYYGTGYGSAGSSKSFKKLPFREDIKWRKKWSEPEAHPPSNPSDIDKFGWFWSYTDHVWYNADTGVAVKELTYRIKPQYASNPSVVAFDNETNAEPINKSLQLEGNIKDKVNVDQFEDEGGLVSFTTSIAHLEKQDVATLCKRFSSWAKAMQISKGELRGMTSKDKIQALREFVLDEYVHEFPYLKTFDDESFDLWMLSQIKTNSLNLTIPVES
jgi:hypothetical protein